MKTKRFFRLAILSVAAVCLFGFLPKAETTTVDAADVTTKKVVGYSYELDYLLEDAGITPLSGQTDVSEGRDIKFGKDSERDLDNVTTDTIEFTSTGLYRFETYLTGEDNFEQMFWVNVVDYASVGNDSLKYDADAAAISEYANGIDVSELKVGDEFTPPSLEKLIKSEYFDYDVLDATVYYAYSSAFVSATSSFDIAAAGKYSFYVLFSDPFNNSITVSDLVYGPDGFYEKDENGNRIGDIIVPVFSITVEQNTPPEVAIGPSEKAFLELEYEISCFTITASDYSTEYSLYYCTTLYNKDTYLTDNDYITAVLADTTLANITEDKLDKDTLKFTPDKKGYYYVQLRVVDGANMSETVMSRAISAQEEAKVVEPENEFFKNNITSVILLGISGICLVAIIVLACIKPKETEIA